jgi:hypothetical protein
MRVEKTSGFFAVAVLAVALPGLVGCGGYSAPSQPPPSTATSVTISLTSASVPAGTGTQNFGVGVEVGANRETINDCIFVPEAVDHQESLGFRFG